MTASGYSADLKHSDTNGDGVINSDDTLAIVQNWGLTHLRPTQAIQSNASSVPFEVIGIPTVPDATINLTVALGDSTHPVDSTYGIAFTINYDASLVENNSASLDFSNSWIGIENTNMITIQKDFHSNGQIKVAMTRIDQQPMQGYGAIATLNLTIKDVIIKNANRRLNLSISQVRLINEDGIELSVAPVPSVVVINANSPTAIDKVETNQVTLFPNPASTLVQIQSDEVNMERIRVYSLTGQELVDQTIQNTNTYQLHTATWSNGIYLVEVHTTQGVERKRLIIH